MDNEKSVFLFYSNEQSDWRVENFGCMLPVHLALKIFSSFWKLTKGDALLQLKLELGECFRCTRIFFSLWMLQSGIQSAFQEFSESNPPHAPMLESKEPEHLMLCIDCERESMQWCIPFSPRECSWWTDCNAKRLASESHGSGTGTETLHEWSFCFDLRVRTAQYPSGLADLKCLLFIYSKHERIKKKKKDRIIIMIFIVIKRMKIVSQGTRSLVRSSVCVYEHTVRWALRNA